MNNFHDATDPIEQILKTEASFYVRQWVDYEEVGQRRLKLLHDIRLHDGREFMGYYPNGSSWAKFWGPSEEGPQRVHDAEVKAIRVSSRQLGDRS